MLLKSNDLRSTERFMRSGAYKNACDSKCSQVFGPKIRSDQCSPRKLADRAGLELFLIIGADLIEGELPSPIMSDIRPEVINELV